MRRNRAESLSRRRLLLIRQIDTATAGTITGTIHLTKTPPPRVQIDMAQDPVCGIAPDNFSEQYVVKNGGLQNVFVYIREGLGGKIYAPSTTPVVLDQKGCRYTPHVIAVMVGQPVDFKNSDATMHNVHLMPDVNGNQSMDVSQPPRGGETQRRVFEAGVHAAGAVQQPSLDAGFRERFA